MKAMPKYIEREALLNAIDTSLHNNPHENWLVAKTHNDEHKHFLSMVLAQPTADVVEVVRCKDCEYYCEGCVCKVHSEYEDKYTRVYTVYKDVDDFCSYGERKGAT